MKKSSLSSRLHARSAGHRFIFFALCSICLEFQALCALNSERSPLVFPSKPAGLTNRPTIGQPQIDLSSALAEKLGGGDITNLLVPSIAHLLSQTERFTLTYGKQPRCRCIVRLSDLAIKPLGNTAKLNTGLASQLLGGLLKAKDPAIASPLADLPANLNWSSDKVKLSVYCAVSVEILDAQTDVVLAEDTGEETLTNSAKAISVDLLGLTYGAGNKGSSDNNGTVSSSGTGTDYQNRLIQLASYRALCKLLPKLDPQLVELSDAPKLKTEMSELANVSPADSAEKAFCKNCGHSVNAGDKFCTHCGTRVSN